AWVVEKGLREQSFSVEVCRTARATLARARTYEYQLIVLDVGLPDRDGFSLCRELRGAGLETPVLMLTARDAVEDRVVGLDAGADDYLVKPFAFAELSARIRALLRRNRAESEHTLKVLDLEIDPVRRAVTRD